MTQNKIYASNYLVLFPIFRAILATFLSAFNDLQRVIKGFNVETEQYTDKINHLLHSTVPTLENGSIKKINRTEICIINYILCKMPIHLVFTY